ncbi:DUF938 domain-containing protein [Nioella nitratireducens]|uniref:DUF938 domain-containing protein n=1 Tax=Nioella nitratireducens TaxID=1287720 RepID=UPI0008FD9165|nr:DUF938 domain-containing protein [Nioella nitratireducens]
MSRKLTLPDAPKPMPDRRMSAPSALRNAWPILEVLEAHAPQTGRVLEIAAGTGEHAVRFAKAMRGLDWQPTDVDPERLASIDAWRIAEGPANLFTPIALDATQPGWAATHGPVEMILLVNLLHLISSPEAEAVLSGIAAALAPGGVAFVYGPFLRDGQATSQGDASFHASLQAQDPEIGYKDVAWVKARLAPLSVSILERPANNLMLIARAPV